MLKPLGEILGAFVVWEAFGRTANYLPVMSNAETGWTPTLYVTLTHPEGSTLDRMLGEAQRWLCDVRNATKTHLRVLSGYEDEGNLHIHLRISVPNDELDNFNARKHRISKYRFWKWHSDIQDFKLELLDRNRSYIVDKHTEIHFENVVNLCPQKFARCRKGKCEHRAI